MDFVKDNNPTALYASCEAIEPPDYVKQASIITPESLVDLDKVAFADPEAREFPIHTPAATWLSAAYALGAGLEGTPIFSRIKTAAILQRVAGDVTALVDAFHQTVKEASAPARVFALTASVDGQDRSFYPINDEQEIIDSSRAMLKDADEKRLPFSYFRKAATALVKAAHEKRLNFEELHERIIAVGEARLLDFDQARQVAELRKYAGADDEAVALYKEALEGARNDPSSLERWMDLWVELDESYQVKYSSVQPHPYLAFFSGPVEREVEKMASEVVLINDILIPKTVIPLVPEIAVRQHFTKDAAEQVIEAQRLACDDPSMSSVIWERLGKAANIEFLTLLQRFA